MSGEIPVVQGDLVKTSEGYFAIVLFIEGDELGVFLCNGLATVERVDQVEVMTLPSEVSHANFSEIIGPSAMRL